MNDGANLYLYDAEGHVCAIQSSPVPGITVLEAYIYDAEGQRVEKGQITTFSCNLATNGYKAEHAYALGQSGEQITEVDGSGNWLHTNVYAAGQLFASYDQNGNSLNFQLTDWLGTRRVQTNYAGVPEASFQSLPFGSRFASIPATNCTPDQDCYPADMTGTALHFTGKENDTESGLDYFAARYYSSTSGRFISPDWSTKEEPVPYAKLGDPQTLNLYAYVGNNPLTSIDIDGHKTLLGGIGVQGCAGEGSDGCSPSEVEAQHLARQAQAQQQSGTSSTEAQNEQHQYDLVVERTNKLLGGAKDSDGDVINAADHISSACGLVGGNCEFKIKNGDADSDFRSALNKSLGEADGDTGAHGGLSAPTHRVGFSTSLHHDNDALHVDHYNGAKFPLGTLLHAIVDVGVGHLPYYGSNHAFSYAGVQ